ncbi:MAG: hypothetical protein ACLP5H_34215 [Desulfomonilaceae bacterium]
MSKEDYTSEMVTEISANDQHPFPVPRETMERVRKLQNLIRPVGDCHNWKTFSSGDRGVPALLSNWETSQIRLGGICESLHNASWQIDGADGVMIRALVLALEREIIRQDALRDWGQETLKYDPAIQTTPPEAPALRRVVS